MVLLAILRFVALCSANSPRTMMRSSEASESNVAVTAMRSEFAAKVEAANALAELARVDADAMVAAEKRIAAAQTIFDQRLENSDFFPGNVKESVRKLVTADSVDLTCFDQIEAYLVSKCEAHFAPFKNSEPFQALLR